jgi:hypothetical protein
MATAYPFEICYLYDTVLEQKTSLPLGEFCTGQMDRWRERYLLLSAFLDAQQHATGHDEFTGADHIPDTA